ncbi:MAG: peptide chain release factor N(5)-glutamine methyltransferase [Verrucomicrobiales bacterium]|nr:peptide chain release factor N(5)-glutamine methyltransferase [Verrucomicrobiales bacterium]
MTVLEVIKRSTEFLTRKGVDSPRLQVEWLLAHALKMPRLQLYLNFERVLHPLELETIRELVRRRGNREPLQHIVGSASFCGLEILVNPDVLIPRPETELLAECGWQFLQNLHRDDTAPATALDFGTGSGCIAIALATKSPKTRVCAVDISEAALKVSRTNAERNQVGDRIEFLCAGSLEELPSQCRFDLIISNPPYIPSREIATLAPEVRDFDPRLALDGGEDGLDFFRQLARACVVRLESAGRFMIEFGDGQEHRVAAIFQAAGLVIDTLANDLNGRPRILIARRGED